MTEEDIEVCGVRWIKSYRNWRHSFQYLESRRFNHLEHAYASLGRYVSNSMKYDVPSSYFFKNLTAVSPKCVYFNSLSLQEIRCCGLRVLGDRIDHIRRSEVFIASSSFWLHLLVLNLKLSSCLTSCHRPNEPDGGSLQGIYKIAAANHQRQEQERIGREASLRQRMGTRQRTFCRYFSRSVPGRKLYPYISPCCRPTYVREGSSRALGRADENA